MPALEMHKAKLLLAAAADRLPDIASVDSFWMPLFLEGHHAQPLDLYWPAADRADYVPFATSALSDQEGHVYGMWHGTDCRMLYYRKDLVPVPPKTWDELIQAASRIAREKHIAGYLYNAGRWEAAVFDHLGMFWGQGGQLVDDGGRPCSGRRPIARRWFASCASCARPSPAAPRHGRCWVTTTTSSSRPPPSRATRRCSSAATGNSKPCRKGSRRRSSRSGTSLPSRRRRGPRKRRAPAAGCG